jgi:predicted NAD/FAD-dependent oxidoreductase
MTTLTLHRWRYALVTRPLGVPCRLLAGGSLGLCGDWCLGPRVEAAWASGSALGRELAL